MSDYTYDTTGVCAKRIFFSVEDGKLHNVRFAGGCPGNTAAIGRLLEGADAKATMDLLRGNDCGGRGTSCADQLSRGIEQALAGRA
ncbi:MAG: TIGR03905 family TSCPD domain-containing protein [Kiritimatiellae bacterium]|nr:TIGR03905 family TSCPD domain-containing protein [Kiritimatiellia bacterium]